MLCYPVNHSIVLIGMQDVVMGFGFGFSLCLVGHSGIGIGSGFFLVGIPPRYRVEETNNQQ